MQLVDIQFVKETMFKQWDRDWEYGIDGDELAMTLNVGDNFVVNAQVDNDENADFWIICCTKHLHKVKKAFKCECIEFEKGDDVAAGKYYQKWGNSYSSYVLLKDSHIVYMHAHLVRAVKFLMPPKDH